MEPVFGRVGIYGVGLIGGSLGLALRKRKLARGVHGMGRNPERLRSARERGVIDSFSVGADSHPDDLDILVLGTPLSVYGRVLGELRERLAPGTIVTDVGSAQAAMAGEVDRALPPGVPFVGAHPMAGGERSGFEAAEPDLFEGATCALCPTPRTTPECLDRIRAMWEHVGCRTVVLDAKEHDRLVGWASHLPHVTAAALVRTVAAFAEPHPRVRDLVGAGFADTTRIASGDPIMWRDICGANKANLIVSLRCLREQIDAWLKGLETDEGPEILRMLAEAKEFRDALLGNDGGKP